MNINEFKRDILHTENRARNMKDKVKALCIIDACEMRWKSHHTEIFNNDSLWDIYTNVVHTMWREILYSCTDNEWDRYGNTLPD